MARPKTGSMKNAKIGVLSLVFFNLEARICSSFTQTQPQNILSKIIRYLNISQKSKFHDFTYAWGKCVGKGYQNIEKFALSRLPKSLRMITIWAIN